MRLTDGDRDTPPPPLDVEFRPVPGFPRHRVGSDRGVWFDATRPGLPSPHDRPAWRRLKSFPVSGSGRFVRLRHGGREYVRSVELLFRAAFSPRPALWLDRVGPKTPRAAEIPPATPAAPVVYRPVPGFDGYRVGSDRSVWSSFVGRGRGRGYVLSDPPVWRLIRPGTNRVVRLCKGGRNFAFSLVRLFRDVFPDAGDRDTPDVLPAPPAQPPAPPIPGPDPIPAEPSGPRPGFRPVPDFPGYVIDADRSVWSSFVRLGSGMARSDPPVWRRKAVIVRDRGPEVVQLWRDGRAFQRSVEKLYRKAFAPVPVPRPEPLPVRGVWGEPSVGSAHGRARLDEEKVAEARRMKREGWTYPELAVRYGVGKVTLWNAISGRTWSHVPMEPGPE